LANPDSASWVAAPLAEAVLKQSDSFTMGTEPAPLRGLWCATLTPLHSDANIDYHRLAAHVRRLLDNGVDGIVLFGTTGEGPSFSVAERSGALDVLLAAGIAPSRVLPATGCTAFPDAVTLTRHAVDSGCPGCLALPPFFWKDLDDEALFRFYSALIETVGCPQLRLYLYHIPQLSGVPITCELVVRLRDAYPAILAGVKDSGGDFEHTLALLRCGPTLSILSGHEPDIPKLMRAGGAGTICGSANLYPLTIRDLLDRTANGTPAERVNEFLRIVKSYPFVPAFKAILAEKTGETGWTSVRQPLNPLVPSAREALLAALRQAALLERA
jgi:4-hydroxy-tetrahydrodipicolinate synthase